MKGGEGVPVVGGEGIGGQGARSGVVLAEDGQLWGRSIYGTGRFKRVLTVTLPVLFQELGLRYVMNKRTV